MWITTECQPGFDWSDNHMTQLIITWPLYHTLQRSPMVETHALNQCKLSGFLLPWRPKTCQWPCFMHLILGHTCYTTYTFSLHLASSDVCTLLLMASTCEWGGGGEVGRCVMLLMKKSGCRNKNFSMFAIMHKWGRGGGGRDIPEWKPGNVGWTICVFIIFHLHLKSKKGGVGPKEPEKGWAQLLLGTEWVITESEKQLNVAKVLTICQNVANKPVY